MLGYNDPGVEVDVVFGIFENAETVNDEQRIFETMSQFLLHRAGLGDLED